MSNPDEYIGFMIADVARLLRTAFDRRVRKLGLTRAQWMVLTRLHRHAGVSQSELAEMMEIERATTGRLIDRLEAKGWVTRRAHKTDRRINRIYLTPEAERIHKRIWKIAKATVNDAMVELSIEETVQVLELLGRMKSRLIENAEQPAARRNVPDGKRAPGSVKCAAIISIDDAEPIAIDDEVVIT